MIKQRPSPSSLSSEVSLPSCPAKGTPRCRPLLAGASKRLRSATNGGASTAEAKSLPTLRFFRLPRHRKNVAVQISSASIGDATGQDWRECQRTTECSSQEHQRNCEMPRGQDGVLPAYQPSAKLPSRRSLRLQRPSPPTSKAKQIAPAGTAARASHRACALIDPREGALRYLQELVPKPPDVLSEGVHVQWRLLLPHPAAAI